MFMNDVFTEAARTHAQDIFGGKAIIEATLYNGYLVKFRIENGEKVNVSTSNDIHRCHLESRKPGGFSSEMKQIYGDWTRYFLGDSPRVCKIWNENKQRCSFVVVQVVAFSCGDIYSIIVDGYLDGQYMYPIGSRGATKYHDA